MDKTSVRYCAFLVKFPGPVTNRISLGICAMDYRADNDPYATGNTPGLIVDDVSRHKQPRITGFANPFL